MKRSREESEQDPQRQYEDMFPKGPGDPDAYGYPGEPDQLNDLPVSTEPVVYKDGYSAECPF